MLADVFLHQKIFLVTIFLLAIFGIVYGKCYTTKPGITIPGADYRKEYELRYEECGRLCHNDISCMAFEWAKKDGDCILKARSLNGTFAAKSGTLFGLCLDRDDPESMRDFFYDHEFGGIEYASKPDVIRDECAKYCLEQTENSMNMASLSFSWRPYDPKNSDASEGKCVCVKTLHYVKVHFGSIAGYLI